MKVVSSLPSGRLFAFGCSFTNYHWPTWADIMGIGFEHYENWGRIGSGNHYIFYSVMECIAKNKITKDDTVAIMWTTADREDRFLSGKWCGQGSIYSKTGGTDIYGEKYINTLTDINGYRLYSVALIKAVEIALADIGCEYHPMAFTSLDEPIAPVLPDQQLSIAVPNSPNTIQLDRDILYQITDTFSDTLDSMYPAMYSIIYTNNVIPNVMIPMVVEAELGRLRDAWNDMAGCDWPPFDDFCHDLNMGLPSQINDEIRIEGEFDINIKFAMSNRIDAHPIPSEALYYLQHLDGITISSHQIAKALEWNTELLTEKEPEFNLEEIRQPVNRISK